ESGATIISPEISCRLSRPSPLMLPDPGQKHAEDAPSDEPKRQCRQYASYPSRFQSILRCVRLDDAFDIGLLAPRLVTGFLQRRHRARELLVGELTLEREPLILDGGRPQRPPVAHHLGQLVL